MNDQKAKADSGKPKLSLVPRRIIFDIARIREYGNNKYPEGGKDNWRNVEPERYRDAAFRHFLAYLDDPYGVDAESGFPHLHHLATNIAFLCELEDPKMETEKTIRCPLRGLRAKNDPIDDSPFGPLPKIKEDAKDDAEWLEWNTNFDNEVVEEEPSKTIHGAIVQKYSDGKLNMQLSESTMNLYKDLRVEHMEPEPGFTKWEKAFREHGGEAEFYRRNAWTKELQFGDYDFESGEIIPRKEQK